jgi:methane/ammonia monooxygenase subunit A
MATSLQARPRPAFESVSDQQKAFRVLDLTIAAILVVLFMALYHVFAMLTVGDWDFWVDWKDQRYWILWTPTVLIAMPAAAQFIFWEKFRLPFAATFLTLCLVLAEWLNRVVNMHGWAYFPMDFIWPATLIPCGIVLDVVLMQTGSYVLTAIIGGGAWGALFYPANWVLIARYMVPINVHGFLMTIADAMGYHFIRTGTPEYIRLIDRGTLRSFSDDPVWLSLALAVFLSMVVYAIGMTIGYLFTRSQFVWLKRI